MDGCQQAQSYSVVQLQMCYTGVHTSETSCFAKLYEATLIYCSQLLTTPATVECAV